MVKNSMHDKLFPSNDKAPMKSYMKQTLGGKPLLQVCIENEINDEKEDPDKRWDLKKLMVLLLTIIGLDPNEQEIEGKQSLLSYCYMKKKHRAFHLLLEVDTLDPNTVNNEDQ